MLLEEVQTRSKEDVLQKREMNANHEEWRGKLRNE